MVWLNLVLRKQIITNTKDSGFDYHYAVARPVVFDDKLENLIREGYQIVKVTTGEGNP